MKELNNKLLSLLDQANIKIENIELIPISFGGNNKTFQVCGTNVRYIFKEYFRHDKDPRDRLLSEYFFLNYAKETAPNWVPKPISMNIDNGCALYEFVEGENYSSETIGRKQIDEAAQFFVDLNSADYRSIATKLPLASEACFSISSHISLVNKRLENLCQIDSVVEEDEKALIFCRNLKTKAEEIIQEIKLKCRQVDISYSDDLAFTQRCVSPSDFGFHNAIRTTNGSAKFIDFEYAGWDDPAKMVGDFFAQLAVPIPNRYFDEFAHKCMRPFSDADSLIKRSYLLAPLYKIKWCCIALNVFLPVNLARRKFANNRLDEDKIKVIQLTKARDLLNSLED